MNSLVLFPAGSYASSNGGLLSARTSTASAAPITRYNAIFPLTSTAPQVPGG